MAGTAVFQAQTLGAPRVAEKLSSGARELRGIIMDELRHAAPELVGTFQHHAPYDYEERDAYHMRDNIEVDVRDLGRAELLVRVEAISPESGYDYLEVTRFGHEGPIFPVSRKWLKWTSAGRVRFAKVSAGSHPAFDWVQAAEYESDIILGDISDRVGRQISTRVL